MLNLLQYVARVPTPFDTSDIWDSFTHNDYILAIIQKQETLNIFGYPSGAHILTALNAELSNLQVQQAYIIHEAVSVILFTIGFASLGAYFLKHNTLGSLLGILVSLSGLVSVLWSGPLQAVYAYFSGICLFPTIVATTLRITQPVNNYFSLAKQLGILVVTTFSLYFIHPSTVAPFLLFSSLYFATTHFKYQPLLCTLYIITACLAWFYASQSAPQDPNGGLMPISNSLQLSYYYTNGWISYVFLFFAICGMVYFLFRYISLFVFGCVGFVAYFLILDGTNTSAYYQNPILNQMFNTLTQIFYNQQSRTQAFFAIIFSLMILGGLCFLIKLFIKIKKPLFKSNQLVILPATTFCIALAIPFIFNFNEYLILPYNGFRGANYDIANPQQILNYNNIIQKERQFLYYTKSILPVQADVQVDPSHAGLLLKYLQHYPAYPTRADISGSEPSVINPYNQSFEETCQLISQRAEPVYFLEMPNDPHAYYGDSLFLPPLRFMEHFPTISILTDGVNKLYQFDCDRELNTSTT
jgi:hypothetical protein